jgi:hypothetical protein
VYLTKKQKVMIAIEIDETTETGRSILRELADNPEAGTIMEDGTPCDGDGTPWEEVLDEINRDMSEVYGVDFAKVTRLINSGEMDENDITNEMLLSPKFKYEPYPGFTPRPRPEYNPDTEWAAVLDSTE